MLNGRNPTRRNRNIGTAKQGHGQNNKLTIPQPKDTFLRFYERLVTPLKEEIVVHGYKITILKEPLKKGYFYSCTIRDVEKVLNHLPKEDVFYFEYIVFRQPKKKESTLSSVWGRLIYSFEYQDEFGPAIIIEATPNWTSFIYPKKQSVEEAMEFELLQDDGMKFSETKRNFVANIDDEIIRKVQLYRTLLHEVGHYVQYLNVVEKPRTIDEDEVAWQERYNRYFKISTSEKENFANKYAREMREKLISLRIIPFGKIEE